MTSPALRKCLTTAVSVLALTLCFAPASHAQEAALGADTELAAKGVWNATATYAKDDIVTTRGSAWISLKAGNKNKIPGQTNPSSSTWWRLFARGFNPTGAWSNSTKYQPDDLVTHNGQTWRAKITNLNKQPAANANWELLAQKGDPGPNTIANGTQNVPSISFNGDANTGIFSPGADKVAIVEGGLLFLHNKGTRTAALGLEALANNTTGTDNTAVGETALKLNVGGHFNTAFGSRALVNATLSANTGIGYRALEATTIGQFNTGVGYRPLFQNTEGSFNTALGANTLSVNETGANNVAVGHQALESSTTADNTAIGYQALKAQDTGFRNIAVGAGAMTNHLSGNRNVAVGYNALSSNTAGERNNALGAQSLVNSIGSGNVAVGNGALANLTSGDNNVALGPNAGIAAGAGTSNSIYIGSEGTLDNGNMIDDSSVIRIGSVPLVPSDQDAQTKTFIAGIRGAQSGTFNSPLSLIIDSNTGQIGPTPPSSRRVKDDIESMDDVSAVLAKLRPVTFRYKMPANDGGKPLHYGLIAEEVAEVMPYLVVHNPDGTIRTVHYERLPTFLLAGWQAQQKTIAALHDEVRQQKDVNATQADEIAGLKQRLAAIEAMLPRVTRAAVR